MKQLRIIFMGTPEFAVPSLDVLMENGFNVVGVITAPDKPQGRGQALGMSPVKEAAIRHGIPVLQPTNLKADEFQSELKKLNANLQVVVAFRMLPESVWSMPEHGTFNLHASLLPQYRGAAPINWAIINGEKETGVTTFFLQHEIDTGNVIFQEKEIIHPDDTAGSLYERLMRKGSSLVLKTVQAIASGDVRPKPQPLTGDLKKAPKIFKETCKIDWNQPAASVRDFIRGLSPYPAAWTEINGKTYKIFSVAVDPSKRSPSKPGDIDSDNRTYICVGTADGWLKIDELQAEGKKKMHSAEFLKGNNIGTGG
jgi:methionyl-tRNA formyltransferase